jgi:hypothetical protein
VIELIVNGAEDAPSWSMTRNPTTQKRYITPQERMTAALARAVSEEEAISAVEERAVHEAWEDIEMGLLHSEKPPLLTTWCDPISFLRHDLEDSRIGLEWTHVVDVQLLDALREEPEIWEALDLFTTTAQGQVKALQELGQYRLHVGRWRIRFAVEPRKVRVLGIFSGEPVAIRANIA